MEHFQHENTSLEGRVTSLEIRMAVAESNIAEVRSQLNKIDAGISKLTWIVISSVVGAVLAVVLKGGGIL